MTDLFEFDPLFEETPETIRGRMDADANAGLETSDPRYVNLREGSFYFDMTQVALLELARLWDALALEVPASAFPAYAWGPYLDGHAATFGLERKESTAASGEVTFTGTPATLIPQGTIVDSDPTSEEGDTLEYATTDDATLSAQVATPGTVTPTASTTGGALVSTTYYYLVSAYNEFGETPGSEVAVITIGPAASVALAWADVTGATAYRVYRSTVSGGPGIRIYDGATSDYTDDGSVVSGTLGPPTINSTAGATVGVQAVATGSDYNVAPLAITNLETVNLGVNAVRNDEAVVGGSDAETDEALRERILIEFAGAGAGNINDYRRWALSIEGVGEVYVEPVADGPGTVTVVVADADGNPVSSDIITAVQAFLDPVPGQAKGQAPPGITVTVTTPALLLINVVAVVTFETGFDLDGGSGFIGLRGAIEDSLAAYVNNLEVGEDVVFDHVKAQFFAIDGILAVSGVTTNGGTANIAVAADQIPKLGTVTLS